MGPTLILAKFVNGETEIYLPWGFQSANSTSVLPSLCIYYLNMWKGENRNILNLAHQKTRDAWNRMPLFFMFVSMKAAVESLASWKSSFPKNSRILPKSSQWQHSLDFCHVSAMLASLLTNISFLPDFKTGLLKNSYYWAARIWIKLIDLNLGGLSMKLGAGAVKFHLVYKRYKQRLKYDLNQESRKRQKM